MRTFRHPRGPAGLLVGVLLATAAAAMPAAYADPPDNDAIGNADEIAGVLPFKDTVRTQEATSSRRDGECVYGGSVWYRYVPTETKTLRAVTIGSNYDTVLAVFVGPKRHRELVGCNDDAGGGLFSAVKAEYVAGQTYWIAVSRCCSTARPGKRAVLHFYEPEPAGIHTTIGAVEAGDISGRLIVHGTTVCDTPSQVEMSFRVSQKVGDGVARSFDELYFASCTPAGTTWRRVLDSDTGWAFQGGRQVAVSWWSRARDGFGSDIEEADAFPTVVTNPNARRR